VLINTASPGGSTGMTTNIMPSMTLGCGAMAGNITSDNVGPQHLINIKRLAYAVRTADEALKIPTEFKTEPVRPPAPQPVAVQPVAAQPVAAQPARIDRQTVTAAVERYLAQRGISVEGSGGAAPAPAPARVTSSVLANVTSEVVDRFLAARRGNPPTTAPPACPCEPQPAAAQPAGDGCGCGAPQNKPAAQPQPPAPEVVIADFVCENDVRTAIQKGKKIYTGPKTIVTPAARDLGEEHGVLVVAHR
jgi:acetaldehyde dehydrogenase (acetylating)